MATLLTLGVVYCNNNCLVWTSAIHNVSVSCTPTPCAHSTCRHSTKSCGLMSPVLHVQDGTQLKTWIARCYTSFAPSQAASHLHYLTRSVASHQNTIVIAFQWPDYLKADTETIGGGLRGRFEAKNNHERMILLCYGEYSIPRSML